MTFFKKLFLIIIKNQSKFKLGTDDAYHSLTDEELVQKIVKNNDPMLFGRLYDRYATMVYNKCYGFAKTKSEAEDLTQDVFLLLFIKLKTFKGNSKFSTWLYSLTYNFCANYVNRDKQKKINDNSVSLENQNQNFSTDDISDVDLFQMKSDKLAKALKSMDPDDKSILLLKYQDGVSIKELTKLLEVSESAIKMRLKRAKARIIEIYNTQEQW